MHLYLRESPRTLILVTSAEDERLHSPRRALVFRAAENRSSSQVVVEFLQKDEVDLGGTIRISIRPVYGCLGLIAIGSEIFLAVVTSAAPIGNIRPASRSPEFVSKIHEVSFYGLNTSLYDDLSAISDLSFPTGSAQYGPDQPDALIRDAPPAQAPVYEHPCAPLTKILESGTFYYATQPPWDLSTRLGKRMVRQKAGIHGKDLSVIDDRFVWNEYIVRSLLDFRDRLEAHEREELDRCQFIILAIQGYVGLYTIPLPPNISDGKPNIGTLGLISRLGWKRAGTRFNTRGVDDDGNVANFVETETMFSTDEVTFSYVQVRGSVPLFWEQQGLQTFGQRIQITRPQLASQPAFDRHFTNLIEEYLAVHAINLLGTKENEAILTNAYSHHLQTARSSGLGADLVGMTHFDFHNAVRVGGHDSIQEVIKRKGGVRDAIERFEFTIVDNTRDELITEQKGVFRTNCLDCLDRTNFIQDILSRTTLELHLNNLRQSWTSSSNLWGYHRELWAENGDALSRIYAGTGALNTSYTRSGKRTLAGVLSDATKSVSRAYINNFQDKGKQVAIDTFLGNLSRQKPVTIFDPIHDSVRATLASRLSEYSTTKFATIFVGTWNLCGQLPGESLIPWLFPREGVEPDMFVIGFQEIVALTAQQIVQPDPEKKRMWEAHIVETLAVRPDKKSDYLILRSEQLVGTALIILVKAELTGVIRSVEGATRKTGLRGISGNKGAVSIRLDYHDTSFCFITAHLAAGHSNVEERNNDYRTIVNGLQFLKGKTIGSHDNVIWLADTNYRIDLDNEVVRASVVADNLDSLLAADQLKRAIDSQAAFIGYEEGPILFRPTYRYDFNSDNYDTSEKMRIPAWTDRILYRGDKLDLAVYSRAELRSSDHRPVFAIFRSQIRIIDVAKRTALSQQLLKSVTSTAPGQKLDEKLANMTLSNAHLPPPSSDDYAWWDGPGHPNGKFPPPPPLPLRTRPHIHPRPTNPFDSDPSSASSSDEELYNDAYALPAPIAPTPKKQAPPPPPPPRPVKPPTLASVTKTTSSTSTSPLPPPPIRR